MLSVRDVKFHAGSKEILKGITTTFEPGLFHVIVGPNGSGKSTFLKIFSGEQKPQQGKVLYDEQDVFAINKTALARRRAVMSQQPELHFPLTVAEIVMFGRYPHFTYKPSKKDELICRQALEIMEVASLMQRDYLTLSGGEKQRVQFARILAQVWEAEEGEKKYLMLDEAISHLDLKHQHQLLKMAKDFCSRQATVIAILHDLNLAMHYADRILFMKDGRIVHELLKTGDLTPDIIREVFEVESGILYTDSGKPVLVF
jgi:iron complex transport system ATP-binding protein